MAEKEKTKARTLDGKVLAAEIRSQVAAELQSLREKQPGFQPGLTIVQVVCRKLAIIIIVQPINQVRFFTSRSRPALEVLNYITLYIRSLTD